MCIQNVFVRFVCFSEYTAIISLNGITNWSFVTEMQCVDCMIFLIYINK